MKTVASVLETIKANARGEAALLVAIDGKILAATVGTDAAMTAIATYAANYVTVSERMGEDTQRGLTQALILIYRGKAIVLSPLGRSAVALIVGSRDAHLGNLRYQLRKGIADLVRAAGEEMPDLQLEIRAPMSERAASSPAPPRPTEAGPTPVRPPMTSRPGASTPKRDEKDGFRETTAASDSLKRGEPAASKSVEDNGAGAPLTEKVLATDFGVELNATVPSQAKATAAPPVESTTPPVPRPTPPAKAEPVAPPAAEKPLSPQPQPFSREPNKAPQATGPSAPREAERRRDDAATAPVHPKSDHAASRESSNEVDEFMARIKDTVEKMQVHPGTFSIAALALEGFGEITPPLPRPTRDAVVQLCNERLRKALRAADVAVQFKDGTFGLLLAGVRSNQAKAVVQRVTSQVLEGNLDHPTTEVTFQLRAGIATYPEGGASAERLVRRATSALFISQIEGAIAAARKPAAEFSVAILSLEGDEKAPAMARGLALFVQRLEVTLRTVDVATQLDDRKFGLLLMGVNQPQAAAIVQRIRDQALKDNLGVPTSEIHFRLRAGIATYPDAGPLADGLLYHAESSLTFLAP